MSRKGYRGYKQWLYTRSLWHKMNPPPYQCALCLRCLSRDELTLDHIKPWAMYPYERYKTDNLQAACMLCNQRRARLLNGLYKDPNSITHMNKLYRNWDQNFIQRSLKGLVESFNES